MTRFAELLLGMRLAVEGGRESRARVGLTAIGVGIGVALLLLAASVPVMETARQQRAADRMISVTDPSLRPSDSTVLVRTRAVDFGGHEFQGVHLQPEGPLAPTPPGVDFMPAPGEMVVSPALSRLLDSGAGELLRPRLEHTIVGVVGDEGLVGPNELFFYVGDDTLSTEELPNRIDGFGGAPLERSMGVLLVLLLTVGVSVLLLPVGLLVMVAMRFGGDERDRRLAALRLMGADAGMTRRIAAGESLLAAVCGIVVGIGLFFAGRGLVEYVTLADVSVFVTDVRPSIPLALVILVAVPALAVLAGILAMRRLVVEPLSVVRRGGTQRRAVLWRLLAPVVGVALLVPQVGALGLDSPSSADLNPFVVAAGAVLVLVGVGTLLPWLSEGLVGRFRGGGSLSWQLATRRLQMAGGSVGRLVSGVAVAVAGAIALQILFAAVYGEFTIDEGEFEGAMPVLAVAAGEIDQRRVDGVGAGFSSTVGVGSVSAVSSAHASVGENWVRVVTGRCVSLAVYAELGSCVEGDVFVVVDPPAETSSDVAGVAADDFVGRTIEPGALLRFHHDEVTSEWTLPSSARTVMREPDPHGWSPPQILATPAAGIPGSGDTLEVRLLMDPSDSGAIERVRNTAYAIDPWMHVQPWQQIRQDNTFASVQRMLTAGVVVTLAVIGLSLLVNMVEQLRERRRLLAVLVAFGTRRLTLAWSVLWQTVIPIALGLVVAILGGAGLGWMLLGIADLPVEIDSTAVALISAVAGLAVLLVTALTMPVLWRLMRADGLRTE